ncbi:hypothetical protein M2277_005625 [Paenibacillus sp. LBL]|uniref:hypothetical protein n=1 Tax=Paenibacillus sp. LBL TaxID=2940563 RepID=UPI002475106C|nr:hypothetical protein [Paenibacillus sp. LBL]MDH6674926.1 hypothetical protein [Paenibacillus sp. LBL]
MKKTLRLIIVAFCLLLSFLPTRSIAKAEPEPDLVTDIQLQSSLEQLKADMVTKEGLKEIVEQQGKSLTKEELTQQLIDTQKSRIQLLEGNFNALLSFLAVIIAVITLFGGIFVWISRKTFSSKVDEVENRLDEMKKLKNETVTKMEAVRELSSNLNVAIREAQDLQISLNKSKILFEQETERINLLGKYVEFLELKIARPELIRTFEENRNESKRLISELEYWLAGTLPNYGFALTKVTEVLGENVIKEDETIQDKLSHYKEVLEEYEATFWKVAATPLEWENYEDEDIKDYSDPLQEKSNNWKSVYENIKKVHGIIGGQISMNPHRFIPNGDNS